jgi:hypothetical protein
MYDIINISIYQELPETIFACIAVNKPQEDFAEFLFDDSDY